MKTLKLILAAICMIVLLQSCEKEAKIRVQNNISKVQITEIYWGNTYITSSLLPGQTSGEKTLTEDKIPATHSISFKMTANNKTVYLETKETFRIDEDDDILIVLDDKTEVYNPAGK